MGLIDKMGILLTQLKSAQHLQTVDPLRCPENVEMSGILVITARMAAVA